MKVWILEIGEPLPLEKDVRLHRYGQFSKWLAKQGDDVTWWASSFSHAPKENLVDYDQGLEVDGVNLKLIYSKGYKNNVSLARIKHNKRFAKKFLIQSQMHSAPDVVIAPVPPIEIASAGVWYALQNNIPVFVDVRDMWPDELVDLAPKPLRGIARKVLFNAFNSMEFACKNATGIMGVSGNYLDYGLKFAGREKSKREIKFPLGYSVEPVSEPALESARQWRKSQGIRDDVFTICFFGTIGRFFDLKTVIDAVKLIGQSIDIQVILGGDGSDKSKFEVMAKDQKSIFFPGWLDAPKISAVMEVSSVGLAPYKIDARMALPNKPFEYMAGSLALLSSIQGELKEVLAENDCGLTYTADNTEELAKCITQLATQKERTKEMGQKARALLEEKYSSEHMFKKLRAHLEDAMVKR